MTIGERIRFLRTRRGMTQRELGLAAGFSEKNADVRIAQYESGIRTPKADLTAVLAEILQVSPSALRVPDIDSAAGLMHTLFALEDRCGLTVHSENGVCLRVDPSRGEEAELLSELLSAWRQAASMREKGLLTQEEYDDWRYHFPDYTPPHHPAPEPEHTLADSFRSREP